MWFCIIISLSLSNYWIKYSKMRLYFDFLLWFPRMNAPYLESSEQIDILFPYSLNKIKFYIFKNISKWLIRVLGPFQYNNLCGLCYDILDKDKKGILMVNKCFVFHEVIYRCLLCKILHSHNRKTFISYLSCHDSWFNVMWKD